MNARTGTPKDYLENDSDLSVDIPLHYYSTDQEVPRQSKDTGVNPQGRILLDHCPFVFNVPVLVISARQPLEEQSPDTNVNTHAMSRPLKWNNKQVEVKF